MNRIFRLLTVGIIVILSGCSFFQDQDEEILPAELVKFNETLNIKKIWNGKVGKGSELLHLSLMPSGNPEIIYTASRDGQVTAFEASSGKAFWRTKLDINLTAGPANNENRIVVYGSDGELICLRSADGSEVWRISIKGESISTPVIADNNVIIYTIDGQLRSFSIFDGTERWSLSQDVPSLTLRGSSTPVILGNNVIVGFDNGRMISVNIEAGMVIWEAMLSPPSGRSDLERLADIDGVIKIFGQDIFVAGYQSQLASVAAESGQTIWSKEFSSEAGIEIDDDSIYLVTDQGFLLGLSRKDGSEVWRKEMLTRRELTAPVRFKSTIVVGDLEGYIHFFDSKSGELVARRRSGKGAVSGVPVVIDEYLYVQNESGMISAFSAPSPEENKDSKRFSLWGT